MRFSTIPLLTQREAARLEVARAARSAHVELTLDLGRSRESIAVHADDWRWRDRRWPYPDQLKARTIYAVGDDGWTPVARFDGALYKLIPTDWGPPTFEIDGIKMLATAKRSPLDDAREKVALIRPQGARVLDCCAGLGYFAAALLQSGVASIRSFEKNAAVLWLRSLNPWSPHDDARLVLETADVVEAITRLPDATFDAALHDPPRIGIAGELYSAVFYEQLARVLVPGGRLFHYTGTPNKLTTGRDVPGEVLQRLRGAGFQAGRALDGVLAIRERTSRR